MLKLDPKLGYRPQDLPEYPPDHVLAKAWKAYIREVNRLLAEGNEGRFALVKDDAVIGVWDSDHIAYVIGRDRFGMEPFLVHQIRAIEPVYRVRGYL